MEDVIAEDPAKSGALRVFSQIQLVHVDERPTGFREHGRGSQADQATGRGDGARRSRPVPRTRPPTPPLFVIGRVLVPGRRKPVVGRPDEVVGRMPRLGMPVCVRVPGRRRDVPGRGHRRGGVLVHENFGHTLRATPTRGSESAVSEKKTLGLKRGRRTAGRCGEGTAGRGSGRTSSSNSVSSISS